MITETKSTQRNIQPRGDRTLRRHPCDLVQDHALDMTSAGQSRKETSRPTSSLSTPKTTLKVGCWNVRTMYQTGRAAQVANEMKRYNIDILGVSECRWTDAGKTRLTSGETILYSGRNDGNHRNGVALILSKDATKCLDEWTPVNDRIVTARFWSKYIKTTVIQVYSPTNEADEEDKDTFFEQLQAVIQSTPRHDLLILLGDWNAKIGAMQDGEEGTVGRHGAICERNDNGERFVDICGTNNMAITTTMFPHKEIHKLSWTSPDGSYQNQIDHVAINSKFKRSLQDVRTYRGADVGSDHQLVIAKIKLRLRKTGKQEIKTRRFETSKLRIKDIKRRFTIEVKNKFSVLQDLDVHDGLEEKWDKIKKVYTESAREILGYRTGKARNG